MIRPSKHAHPDLTVISVAYVLLARIKKTRTESYSEFFAYLKKTNSNTELLFLPALNFLFMLELIVYRAKADRFEYVGAQ